MTVIKISKDCIQLFLEKCRSKQFVKKICKFIKEVISLIIIFFVIKSGFGSMGNKLCKNNV